MTTINKSVLVQKDTESLKSMTPLKYKWAKRLYDYSNSCFWLPNIVKMREDIKDYRNASEEDRLAYERTLGYLNAADVSAIDNVAKAIANKIDAPEISAALANIAAQEANHSYSYLYMLESLGLDNAKQDEINLMYRTEPALRAKIEHTENMVKHICSLPDEDMTDEEITEFVHGYFYFSQIFEGCFFLAGFNPILSMFRRKLFINSAAMINYIRRDEEHFHVNTGTMIIRQILKEHPTVKLDTDRIHGYIMEAVKHEREYIKFVMPNGLKGYTIEDHMQQFRFLCNQACKRFKIEPAFSEVEQLAWVRRATAEKLVNFFESKVLNYDVNTNIRASFDD
jgi:ribonucleoside-diphosphate reductase beta chain